MEAEAAAFAAALRRLLVRVAGWNNLVFDGDAGRRLLDRSVDPDGLGTDADTEPFSDPGSAGAFVENSIAMRATLRAERCVRTGEWRGSAQDMRTNWRTTLPLLNALDDAPTDMYGNSIFDTLDDDVDQVRSVLLAFHGRVMLHFGEALSITALAALSGLSEKTVRMAAIGRDRHPELATFHDSGRTWIKPAEAARWLATKPRFRPTRILDQLVELDYQPKTSTQLASLLTELRERRGLTVEQLLRNAWLPAEFRPSYQALESSLFTPEDVRDEVVTLDALTRLARALEVPDPAQFVTAVAGLLLPYQVQYRQSQFASSPSAAS